MGAERSSTRYRAGLAPVTVTWPIGTTMVLAAVTRTVVSSPCGPHVLTRRPEDRPLGRGGLGTTPTAVTTALETVRVPAGIARV